MSIRILFVDDEALILSGLRRMLRPYHREWDMTFLDSGEKALAALASHRLSALKQLDLRHNTIGEEAIDALQTPHQLQNLTDLFIGGSRL